MFLLCALALALALALVAPPGRVAPEIIQRVVRASFAEIRTCYQAGLAKDPKLEGRVIVKLVIDTTGHVTSAADAESTLPDKTVIACVVGVFTKLVFPAPSGGPVHIVYPMTFAPEP